MPGKALNTNATSVASEWLPTPTILLNAGSSYKGEEKGPLGSALPKSILCQFAKLSIVTAPDSSLT